MGRYWKNSKTGPCKHAVFVVQGIFGFQKSKPAKLPPFSNYLSARAYMNVGVFQHQRTVEADSRRRLGLSSVVATTIASSHPLSHFSRIFITNLLFRVTNGLYGTCHDPLVILRSNVEIFTSYTSSPTPFRYILAFIRSLVSTRYF